MSRAYIIAGGELDTEVLKTVLQFKTSTDVIVAADAGLEVLDKLNIDCDFVVGDFDTVDKSVLDKYESYDKLHRYKAEKDASDTELAIELCILKGYKYISILGCFGGRMDHSLANIYSICHYLSEGIHIELIDRYNRVYAISKSHTIQRDTMWGEYLSVYPMGGIIKDFHISGVYYPLSGATLDKYKNPSLTISNKLIEDQACIKFEKGIVLVIESKDTV